MKLFLAVCGDKEMLQKPSSFLRVKARHNFRDCVLDFTQYISYKVDGEQFGSINTMISIEVPSK